MDSRAVLSGSRRYGLSYWCIDSRVFNQICAFFLMYTQLLYFHSAMLQFLAIPFVIP